MDRVHYNLTQYRNESISYAIATGTDYSAGNGTQKIADLAGWTLYIQRITLSVTTDAAATQTWQDNAGTPIPIATSKASPGLGPITWDFGQEGFACTEGKGLLHDMSATGLAGAIVIQAYRKKTASN